MIGWYVHHHGAGHQQRLATVSRHLRTPVTALGSAGPPAGFAGDGSALERDDDDPVDRTSATADGALHWVPLHHSGLQDRSAAIAAWIARARPSLFVTDVSVEVTALARLCGVAGRRLRHAGRPRRPRPPPGSQPGTGADSPLAGPPRPARRRAARPARGHRWCTSGRSPASTAAPTSAGASRPGTVLVLFGSGGRDVSDADFRAARAATPGVDLEYLVPGSAEDGAGGEDVWTSLQRAEVVVVHGGHNAVAEVAAARRPAVVIAQDRPFGEQRRRAELLRAEGLVALDRWPAAADWPGLLDRARATGSGSLAALGARGRGAARRGVPRRRRRAARVTTTALLTIVSGRHDHLRGQLLGLGAATEAPAWHVIASMGDADVRSVVDTVPAAPGTRRVVVDVPLPADGELPLARARNAAAAAALDRGADLLVFLDVDCVPSPGCWPATRGRPSTPGCGRHRGRCCCAVPVAYLPPGVRVTSRADLARLPAAARPHAGRPAPAPGQVVRADASQWWLFWSLSFAVPAPDWTRFGGFCEEYRGYGGEDTDVAATVRSLGGSLFWVGGAEAHHQHHPVQDPPVHHLAAIVRNAAVFHRRWGWWPMTGWLEQFRAAGLADYDAATRTWSVAGPSAAAARSTAS